MKTACCWLYAITKYGYPPNIPDTFRVLEEMAALGFQYIELEGVGPANMRAVARRAMSLSSAATIWSCG